jgi:hypothetical protein
MPPQSLVSYIQEQLSKGYAIEAIKQNLINYGYNSSDVDEAVKALYQSSSVKHEIHLGGSTIIAVVIILIGLGLIAAAVFMYMGQNKTPSQLLDMNIIPIMGSVKLGDDFSFTVELSSLGSATRYDVQISYEITDVKTNALLTKKEETIAVETKTSKTTEIKIPDTAEPGDYYMKAVANYDKKTATSSIMFKIYKKSATPTTCFDNLKNQGETGIDCGGPCKPCGSCRDNIKNQNEEGIDCGGLCPPCKSCPVCDDKDSCTDDSCSARTDFKCMYTPITPCCGNNKCESTESVASCQKDCMETTTETPVTEDEFSGLTVWEKIDKIKDMAATDPAGASAACKEISEDLYKDQCYMKVAEATLTLTNCDMITESYSKEKCYASLAKLLNNYNICEQITKESRRDSCFMAFVMDGDYTICDKIVNDYLKNSCNALREIGNNIETNTPKMIEELNQQNNNSENSNTNQETIIE